MGISGLFVQENFPQINWTSWGFWTLVTTSQEHKKTSPAALANSEIIDMKLNYEQSNTEIVFFPTKLWKSCLLHFCRRGRKTPVIATWFTLVNQPCPWCWLTFFVTRLLGIKISLGGGKNLYINANMTKQFGIFNSLRDLEIFSFLQVVFCWADFYPLFNSRDQLGCYSQLSIAVSFIKKKKKGLLVALPNCSWHEISCKSRGKH